MKICFISYHNWETKRHGGFHQFAKATAEQGHETIFFSFARPYYIYWKHEERLNKNILKELSKGKKYPVDNGEITNITFPTLGIPGPFRKYFSYKINEWLLTHSLKSFDTFCRKWLNGTDCFVFESCEAVLLIDQIKKRFPHAKIIYRPSDPLWEFSNDFFNSRGEERMLRIADRIITVNPESIIGYKKKFPYSFLEDKFLCIPNGVNISEYRKTYPSPDILKKGKTATYIGSFLPDWEIIEKAANSFPELTFIIITPHKLDFDSQNIVNRNDNIVYIPGIPPSEVPKWITNSNIILQPFPLKYGHLDKISLGLTAKNYKAMAAGKPIVAYGIPLHLSQYGLFTSDNIEDFITGIRQALNINTNPYPEFKIGSRDWNKLCQRFIKECEK